MIAEIDIRIAIIEAEKKQLLEVIYIGLQKNKNQLLDKEEKELKQLIAERFDKIVKLLESKTYIWDYTISLLQIVSGMVV